MRCRNCGKDIDLCPYCKAELKSVSRIRDGVKTRILNWFKNGNHRAYSAMSEIQFLQDIRYKLNPAEEKEVPKSIEELVKEGLILYDGKNLRLTKSGEEYIYAR